MPCFSKLPRSKSVHDVSIASLSGLDFLTPATSRSRSRTRKTLHGSDNNSIRIHPVSEINLERAFFSALCQASLCNVHRTSSHRRYLSTFTSSRRNTTSYEHGVDRVNYAGNTPRETAVQISSKQPGKRKERIATYAPSYGKYIENHGSRRGDGNSKYSRTTKPYTRENRILNRQNSSAVRNARGCEPFESLNLRSAFHSLPLLSSRRNAQPSRRFGTYRSYHYQMPEIEAKKRQFAQASNLPSDFFDDVASLTKLALSYETTQDRPNNTTALPRGSHDADPLTANTGHPTLEGGTSSQALPDLKEQMKLLKTLRELEERLQRTKRELEKSISRTNTSQQAPAETHASTSDTHPPVLLTKEDYMNLVDLYYYSHNSRFSPESTDLSPTPLFLDDFSFTLSSDFSPGANTEQVAKKDEAYESPLRKVEEQLKRRQLREISVMQVFVDALLDERSSNRALYEAYKELPSPGVAYLPIGVIRLFMQRMSTPWTLSEKSMLRYLSLIDDMQKANIAMTPAEWSSAIYLAGRAFKTITDRDVNSAFKLWKQMEKEAGVQGDHVTFNILFDIAVRSGKFALGETVLKEMHSRNLRLNRLGRVSLMYYHGLRKDGDGVRKAYRDFVEAGEIVDTLVLNCVIASLYNADEPQAAEQIYMRMMSMQSRLVKGLDRHGDETLYKRYPGPGGGTINEEMASNHLGRILLNASRLSTWSVEHHQSLQAKMPLTPNHITFRSMISYHANVSGDLDRLTVLLQEMTEVFHLPFQTITFHLLFKGFTIHGPKGGPHSKWSVKRLDACWKVCVEAIRESEHVRTSLASAYSREGSSRYDSEEDDRPPAELTLPSITQINKLEHSADLTELDLPRSRPSPRKLSGWAEFVMDLAGFSRERQKRLEDFHATVSGSEDTRGSHETPDLTDLKSPYFEAATYSSHAPPLSAEEGGYVLPSPSAAAFLKGGQSGLGSELRDTALVAPVNGENTANDSRSPHQVAATRLLMCWVIRAYARNTKSRRKVEEIWGQIRKIYKPRDATGSEGVVRVLRRCLMDCDREGSR